MYSDQGRNDQIRVVHIVDSFSIGGAEDIILAIVAHGGREIFDVTICCLQDLGEL
jgi:hypothetical protein